MPPSRRRPVPTPPTVRPRVAGLRKRTAPKPTDPGPTGTTAPETAAPEATAPEATDLGPTGTAAPEAVEATGAAPAEHTSTGPGRRRAEAAGAEAVGAEAAQAEAPAGEDAPARSARELGLIEPSEGVTEARTAEEETAEEKTTGAKTAGQEAAQSGAAEEADAPTPRPRPTGRRKRTGEAVAPSVLDEPGTGRPGRRTGTRGADATDEVDGTAEADGTDGSGETPGTTRAAARSPRSVLVLASALVVVAALLGGLGWWFQQQAGRVSYNRALVDSAATTEVAGQAREAVEKAFSYNFADVAATEKAANDLLVGKAQCQYNAIFGPVRTLAPEQKLVVTVKAVSSGVTWLDDHRATVLLFLDQVTTRTTDNQSGGGIAMMRAGLQRVDDRWKVDNMEMFGQTGDQAAEIAKC